ncbi:unnamed protein product [Tuber aestivum]|uniref:Uncharacterized protein n=1 Tax=Tuber aestivum TaxID=59557 RepID=A0A292PUU4_9PEZI|nr:unnamed protein product [Tuber aestivum]
MGNIVSRTRSLTFASLKSSSDSVGYPSTSINSTILLKTFSLACWSWSSWRPLISDLTCANIWLTDMEVLSNPLKVNPSLFSASSILTLEYAVRYLRLVVRFFSFFCGVPPRRRPRTCSFMVGIS